MDVDTLRSRLEAAGQEQLLKYWDTLDDEQKTLLYKDVSSIDVEEVNSFYKQCMEVSIVF